MSLIMLPTAQNINNFNDLVDIYEKSRKQLEFLLNGIDLEKFDSNAVLVEETGSNENGVYRKYSDGTMECSHTWTGSTSDVPWNTVDIGTEKYYYTSDTWTFPKPFLENSSVIVFADGDIGAIAPESHHGSIVDTTKATIESGMFGVDCRQGLSFSRNWLAKGYWK